MADLEGPSCRRRSPASPPCPAPTPAMALRRPLLGRCSPVLTERGTRRRRQNSGFCVAKVSFLSCVPRWEELLLCPGIRELPENDVLCPRPSGDSLCAQCLVRPGGCLPAAVWPPVVRAGLRLHLGRRGPICHRRLITVAARMALGHLVLPEAPGRARCRARSAPGGHRRGGQRVLASSQPCQPRPKAGLTSSRKHRPRASSSRCC